MGLTRITSDGITDGTISTADLADQSVSLAKLPHGTSSNNGKFLRANNGADPTFESVITDLVDDSSPQLGGALDTNGKNINFGDSTGGSADDRLVMGLGQDMAIYHDPSIGNLVKISSGDFLIRHYDEEMIVAKPNGAVELYHDNSKKIETNSSGVHVFGNMFIEDGSSSTNKITLGTGGDLNIYHDGNDSYIEDAGVGSLILRTTSSSNVSIKSTNDVMAKFKTADSVELYHNNTKRFETSSIGATVTGHLTTTGEIFAGDDVGLPDNAKITFGAGNDLKIQSDGSNALLLSDLLYINNSANSENILKATANGAVELYHDNVKQLETTENGILLPKGCTRGVGGSKVILGGTINPSQDKTWNFSFSTNDNGYNEGYVFNIKFYVNHWNHGDYYKYIESISGGRGNVTGLQRVDLINNLGTGSANWSNGHLDYEVSLTGGTREGNAMSLFKVKYDADGAPGYTSGYYLEVNYSNQIGTITIT